MQHGFGTSNFESQNAQQCLDILETAYELGVRHFDTAEIYGKGHAEKILSRFLDGKDRSDLFITSKVWPTNHKKVRRSLERSLANLNTEYLDLYLLHWPIEGELEPVIDEFRDLKSQGKIKHFGVCNFKKSKLKDLLSRVEKNEIYNLQCLFSLQKRSAKRDLLPLCQENSVYFTAYFPSLRSQYLTDQQKQGLEEVANQRGLTSHQLALSYLASCDVVVIPSTFNVDHLKQNIQALQTQLSPEEIQKLENLFPLENDEDSLPISPTRNFNGEYSDLRDDLERVHFWPD